MELVFGGSFDPPTLAHVVLPKHAMAQIGAVHVRYMLASTSPHKVSTPPSPANHRLAMLNIALADAPWASIDTRELEREGPSFMIDTLESLQAQCPTSRRLLIGSDQAMVFHKWHRWGDIMALATPLVMMRNQDDKQSLLAAIEHNQGSLASIQWDSWVLDTPRRSDNSTVVREHGAFDQLNPEVSRYIQQHALYGNHA
jgi:nicotinate-nucleotide adenylyltransferase